jgi:hypothetical protein
MRTACDKATPRLPRRTHEIPYELEIDGQTWNDGNAKNPEILWYRCDVVSMRLASMSELGQNRK